MSKTIAIAFLQQGSAHQVNEDNFYLGESYVERTENKTLRQTFTATSDLQIFAVADGKGGEGLGDESAHLAVQILDQQVKRQQKTGKFEFFDFARQYLDDANRAVAAHLSSFRGIEAGTTISLVAIEKDTAYTLSLGNSRIYLYRDARLHLLTKDHISPLPDQKILSRLLGATDDIQLTEEDNLTRTVLRNGDILLLATDGLTSVLSEDQIGDILLRPAAFVQQINSLRHLVQKHQGRDDMALVAVKVIDPDYSADPEHEPGTSYTAERILSWIKPLLFFLLFVLLGFLAGKLIFTLPGWLRQLGG